MNPNEEGLRDVFIMRDSGECVYHQSYEETDRLEADGTLISSFLSTIEAFSSNVDVGAKLLETANNRFVYHRSGEFIYVARTQMDANADEIATVLNNVSQEVIKFLPEQWDGKVDRFEPVTALIEIQFDKSELESFYEITGRGIDKLDGIEAKIYSFLRFRGRSTLSSISKLMKIPESDVVNVTNKLVEKEFLEACS
ncbi:MAG: hypothetical protein ACXAE3_11300 [Candidatus Kariarchaeaceae archaeon]|jgi:sugar-specific transcriptional regulator TrmB